MRRAAPEDRKAGFFSEPASVPVNSRGTCNLEAKIRYLDHRRDKLQRFYEESLREMGVAIDHLWRVPSFDAFRDAVVRTWALDQSDVLSEEEAWRGMQRAARELDVGPGRPAMPLVEWVSRNTLPDCDRTCVAPLPHTMPRDGWAFARLVSRGGRIGFYGVPVPVADPLERRIRRQELYLEFTFTSVPEIHRRFVLRAADFNVPQAFIDMAS